MIPTPLAELLSNLSLITDRAERIDTLILVGQEYDAAAVSDVARSPATRVPGCESEVFVTFEDLGDGTIRFRIAVDNPQGISAMALAMILEKGLSGQPLDQIIQVSDEMVYQIFGRELSMGKSLGLTNMVRMVVGEAKRRSALLVNRVDS